MVQYVQNKYFFSNAETLCPPGSLSQCKALQKQTKENAPCAASKLLSWIKLEIKPGRAPRPDPKENPCWKNCFAPTAREAAALPELEPEQEQPDPGFAEAEARRLLELLPPAEQELFRKRYLEGYTAAELGKMYGLPPATVRTRLAKARRYLSQLLMEE